MAKYKMTVDFIVDISDDYGLALTVKDISDALTNHGYKTEFVKNISNESLGALYVFGNNHKVGYREEKE